METPQNFSRNRSGVCCWPIRTPHYFFRSAAPVKGESVAYVIALEMITITRNCAVCAARFVPRLFFALFWCDARAINYFDWWMRCSADLLTGDRGPVSRLLICAVRLLLADWSMTAWRARDGPLTRRPPLTVLTNRQMLRQRRVVSEILFADGIRNAATIKHCLWSSFLFSSLEL